MAEIEFRYFSPVKGRAVARFGTSAVIGARVTERGYQWDEDAIVPIPAAEVLRFNREYSNALKGTPRTGPLLVERTREEYEAWKASRTDSSSAGDESEIDDDKPTVNPGAQPANDEQSGAPEAAPAEMAARSTGSRKKKKAGGKR